MILSLFYGKYAESSITTEVSTVINSNNYYSFNNFSFNSYFGSPPLSLNRVILILKTAVERACLVSSHFLSYLRLVLVGGDAKVTGRLSAAEGNSLPPSRVYEIINDSKIEGRPQRRVRFSGCRVCGTISSLRF